MASSSTTTLTLSTAATELRLLPCTSSSSTTVERGLQRELRWMDPSRVLFSALLLPGAWTSPPTAASSSAPAAPSRSSAPLPASWCRSWRGTRGTSQPSWWCSSSTRSAAPKP